MEYQYIITFVYTSTA